MSNSKTEPVNHVINYNSSKMICDELLSREIIPYVSEGKKEANKRSEEFINHSFENIIEKGIDPEKVKESFADPSMQVDFVSAANGYIKYGDSELLNLLSEMLAYRIEEKDKPLLRVTLGEAIKVSPLLLNRHLVTLALRFRIIHSRRIGVVTIEGFCEYFNKSIITIFNLGASKEISDFQHLNYTRCGTTTAFSNDLIDVIKDNYRNVFCMGKTKEEIGKEGDLYIVDKYRIFFTKSWFDKERYIPIIDINDNNINTAVRTIVSPDLLAKMQSILQGESISNDIIRKKLSENINNWSDFEKYWNKSGIANLNLSSVGIVIGAIYNAKITNEKLDLKIWIK